MIYQYEPDYPYVQRASFMIDKLQPPYLGLDFEWDIKTETPTIIGASDGRTSASVPFEQGIHPVLAVMDRFPDIQLVGHNFIRAEKVVLKKFGREIPLSRIQDTIILHWLVNGHLCKAGGKATGESGDDLKRRGAGFMNIWTMCSIHTSLPCWKFCRGEECIDVPCPKHQPFWYNGLDALGPVLAVPDLIRKAKMLDVLKLYPLHAELNDVFQQMKERGVWVDRAFIQKMREEFVAVKEVLWKKDQKEPTPESLPFNPNSHQQIKEYFKEKYSIILEDTEEETIRAEVMDHEDGEVPELEDLLTYKEMGSGPDRWYADRRWNSELRAGKGDWEGYVVDEGDGLGTIHPDINHFTSTGRTACANPNMQNVEKRRIDRHNCGCGHSLESHPEVEKDLFGVIDKVPGPCKECDCEGFHGDKVGERMRQAIIAPPGYNLYSADYSNGENRAMLFYAGYIIPDDQDLHSWMVENIGLKENDNFSILMGGAREASKSVSHASDYMEGLDLLTPSQLRGAFVQREVSAGARLIYPDWKFRDLTVSFTGGNLALRAFGSKTWDNRARALGIVQRYVEKFPKLRDVQRMITKQVEKEGMVRVPHGYVLRSYDRTPEDMIKTAVAMWGSNPIAHYLKLSLLNVAHHPRLIPVIPVHDEHVIYASTEYDPKDVKKWITEAMVFETPEMKGFHMPIKVKVSTREITGGKHPNWRQMKKVE